MPQNRCSSEKDVNGEEIKTVALRTPAPRPLLPLREFQRTIYYTAQATATQQLVKSTLQQEKEAPTKSGERLRLTCTGAACPP